MKIRIALLTLAMFLSPILGGAEAQAYYHHHWRHHHWHHHHWRHHHWRHHHWRHPGMHR